MKPANAFNKLNDLGLPKIWQLFIVLHAFFAFSLILVSNDLLLNIGNILLTTLTPIGLAFGFKFNKHKVYPWGVLIAGMTFVSISIASTSLSNMGLIVFNTNMVASIEEIGILLISLFAFTFMLQFEKEYKLNGFTIDYNLIVISVTIFTLIIFPSLAHNFWYEFSFVQQLNTINLFLSIVFLSMLLINQILCKQLLFKDIVRIIMVLFFSAHFMLDALNSFNVIESNATPQISLSFYHLVGTLSIAFIFLERLTTDYHKGSAKGISSLFMWCASILAIIVIPLGVITRDRLGLPPLAIMVVGTASFILSSFVIWRMQRVVKNINQQRKRLKNIAYVDSLTNLPNFHGYLDQLSNINIDNIFIVSINIEDFKSINDLYGKDFGDEVLKSLSKRIKMLPHNILVARTGADYFHAVFRTHLKDIQKVVDEVQLHLGIWDVVNNCRIAVPLTYGASHSTGFVKPETLARQAEEALKVSRQEHTNFTLYTEKTILSQKKSVPRHELREILQKAVDDNYLPVHFQPIYDLSDGSLKALELLIRIESEEHGLLLPGQFLDQAKSYGLLTPLTEVCISMVAKSYEQLPKVTININIAPYMLNNAKILNDFIHCFEKANLPIEQFCIEITEDGDIPTDQLVPAIKLLKSHGFKIAMDDFGTGYSSLSRLSVLPVDVVKIDRSLLLAASNGDKTILESAISLTKRLGATAVVEGVETLEQLSLIKKLGADSVQGFLLSEPVKICKVPLLSLNATEIVAEF